jgi:hypothetical protein
MTLTDEIQQRLAAAEAAAREFVDKRTPWEVAADEHDTKVEQLHATWQAVKSSQEATDAARRQAGQQLRRHGAALVSIDLADVESWANETARLRRLVDALGERYRLQSQLVDHAQRQYEAGLQDNPAAVVKAGYVGNLRQKLIDSTVSAAEKGRAFAELERIAEGDKIKVREILPPGFDPRKYVRGMRIAD